MVARSGLIIALADPFARTRHDAGIIRDSQLSERIKALSVSTCKELSRAAMIFTTVDQSEVTQNVGGRTNTTQFGIARGKGGEVHADRKMSGHPIIRNHSVELPKKKTVTMTWNHNPSNRTKLTRLCPIHPSHLSTLIPTPSDISSYRTIHTPVPRSSQQPITGSHSVLGRITIRRHLCA